MLPSNIHLSVPKQQILSVLLKDKKNKKDKLKAVKKITRNRNRNRIPG